MPEANRRTAFLTASAVLALAASPVSACPMLISAGDFGAVAAVLFGLLAGAVVVLIWAKRLAVRAAKDLFEAPRGRVTALADPRLFAGVPR